MLDINKELRYVFALLKAKGLPMFYTTKQVANLLKVQQPTVRNMIERGDLPAIRIGKTIRVSKDYVDTLIASMFDRETSDE